MKKHSVTFTVRGSGEFPTDMLRYDNCVPATEEDTAKVKWQYGQEVPDGASSLYRRDVTLIAELPHKWAEPTTRRWESFCWKIVK